MFVRSVQVVSQLLLFQVILITFVQVKATGETSTPPSDLNDETVINDLSNGKRQILAIGRMVHSMDNKIVMLVAQLDEKGKPTQKDDIYVFTHIEQVSKGMVLKGGEMLKSKWPELHHYLQFDVGQLYSILMLSDSQTDYVMVFARDGSQDINDRAFNVITGHTETLTDVSSFFDHGNGISSTKQLACFCTDGYAAKIQLAKFGDDDTFDLDKETEVSYLDIFTICKGNSSDEVTVTYDDDCQPLDWPIWTGFVDDKFVHLIDKQGTVYKFNSNALDAPSVDNPSVKLEKIKRSELFGSVNGHGNGSDDNDHHGNDSHGNGSEKGKSNGEGGLSTGAIVVIAVVSIVFILAVVAVAGYCLCCSGQRSPKQGSKPKSSGSKGKKSSKGSKMSSGHSKKSSKMASKIRSKHRSSAKGGVASKASTRRSSALAHKPASGHKVASSRASSRPSTKPSARKGSSRR